MVVVTVVVLATLLDQTLAVANLLAASIVALMKFIVVNLPTLAVAVVILAIAVIAAIVVIAAIAVVVMIITNTINIINIINIINTINVQCAVVNVHQ
ncbi:hypothetical protein ADU80_05800 [Clostridium botulinum]|uniref:Uncharacterized protein n=1 Tax=Clostridium botulinum TaxID=1491 RepID=A0A9Q1V051_CLOBO|nr:hypothetical protein Z953_00725 [Clostridium botulinum D str. 16868]KEI04524.1 hypothetical protein Y848_01610 [Clostridium botulinum C/D str. Sp77]KLU76693.1 hypothetical protein CBC3_02250 [Clostridium botulinum V891]KOA76124.1 hypothetical protein ADU78_06810 [Clostridium botulinum]MCD3198238.1 hypothetical protein [Clostridium botulinum C/D]